MHTHTQYHVAAAAAAADDAAKSIRPGVTTGNGAQSSELSINRLVALKMQRRQRNNCRHLIDTITVWRTAVRFCMCPLIVFTLAHLWHAIYIYKPAALCVLCV